ncbi:MAG: cyclic nucleotide-binding domain-containing protein [Halobacteriovoraceae bacterium]|jgi:signal-transduction protein with cAMP-binding, CBS, and nucleotidyltransferase domain|nr:cyclic nucleotide-binding domain-containing protein [Halobacteriovoraceae bacterium]MBT5095613.1 cyclic nucleotide-binding domain-containing protein [Halobacteriovoraceae bacterium]
MEILNNYKKLNSEQIQTITKFCPPKLYQTQTELIYEGHVPNVGYFILKGAVEVSLKRKKKSEGDASGSVIGVEELLHNNPFRYTITILPGSEVCILDRSSLHELKNGDIFQELFN